MALTPPPTPPSRTDSPSQFSSRADALLSWLPTMTSELDALQTDVAADASVAGAAKDDAVAAVASAGAIVDQAEAAAAAANVYGNWSSLTGPLSPPASVVHNSKLWVLNTATSNVASDEPGVSAKWTRYLRTEDVYAISGTTPALNPDNGTIQTWTLTGNSSPTDSVAAGQSMTMMIADGTAYAITWPTMTWVGGSAPTLATTGYSVVELWKVGTTLYGAFVGYVA